MNADTTTCSKQGGDCLPRPAARRSAIGLGLVRCFLPVLAALVVCAWPGQSQASWLINQARYHIGAHNSLGCADCHSSIPTGKDHPNPADVSKPLTAFFQADTCLGCHSEISDELAKGTHAGKPVVKDRDYQACITCHDPHYQKGKKELPKAFNPAKPVEEQCGACHEKRTALPALSKDDAACMSCHREMRPTEPGAQAAVAKMCLDCHGADQAKGAVPGMATMDKAALDAATHRKASCLDCHKDAAKFGHDKQQPVTCTQCHARHDEKVAHDAHMTVSCQACHLSGVTPVKDAATGLITAKLDTPKAGALTVHTMSLPEGEKSCLRCHFPGNKLGAAASILPAKGLLCMPCHTATFSVGDTTTALSLIVFLGGMGFLCVFWFSGGGLLGETSGAGKAAGQHAAPATDWGHVWDVAFYDIFLQRRLYRQSPSRWAVHALIFFPFAFRFLWGIVALLGSLWTPEASLPWLMIDKNSPLGGFLFDVSGIMLLIGLLCAAANWAHKPENVEEAAGLPKRDWPALLLLIAIVVVGFILEGMRIAMTGHPAGSGYAFLGAMLSHLFTPGSASLSGSYGTMWYLHAILTGVTVAYVPFSQLRHVVTAPLVMLLGAFGKEE